MNAARESHTATLLPSGHVLVAGGGNMTGTAVASAELYDPTTGTWTMTGSANGVPAFGGFAGLLSPGEVLVTNGHGGYAQLYNPSTSTWTNDNSGHTGGNQGQAVTLLGTGMLLTCGGTQGVYPRKITAISSCDLFDPSTSNLVSTGSMHTARDTFTLTVLPNGQVLAAGGETQDNKGNFFYTNSAELYTP